MFSFITCRKEEGKEDAKNQKTIHDLDQKDTKPATFVYFIILNGVNKKKKKITPTHQQALSGYMKANHRSLETLLLNSL